MHELRSSPEFLDQRPDAHRAKRAASDLEVA
jgi:hypothetical protein